MDLFNLFSFLLLLYIISNASRAEFATEVTLEGLGDFNSDESIEGAKIVVNTFENDMLDGIVVRKVSDNLTLSCSYQGADDKVITVDHKRLQWVLPNENVNRSTKMWKAAGVLWLTVWQLSSQDSGRYTCFDMENRMLVGQAIVIIRSSFAPSVPFCSSPSMFMCWAEELPPEGTHCILNSYICDGLPDCPNARDEHKETCLTDDPCENKLKCADGRCIPKDWCCGNGTLTKYGRAGYNCIPHPCCAQHFKPIEKLGGGWRKKPGAPPFLQMTLYTASFCVLIFVISIAFLISIICRARLKRSAEMSRAGGTNGPRQDPPAPLPSSRCNYTLVPASCETPTSTYSAVLRRYFVSSVSNTTPPTYSQAMAEQAQEDAEPPSYFEIQQEGARSEPHSVQVRRPTDFGMSTLANVLFNARYRPVPQEVVSFGDVSDSDSSCRSPGSHTFNIYPSPNGTRQRTESPFNRLGETPDAFRRSAESRIRRANGLDRILDRFGLNAPYAVGREGAQSRNNSSGNSPTPQPTDDANITTRRQFLSSILERLRNSFYGYQSNIEEPPVDNSEAVTEDGANNNDPQAERRRPDTPDVLELSLDEIDLCRNAAGETFTLNGRTIHLLGASVEDRPDVYGLNLQSLFVVDGIIENLNRFVGRPVSPPPYSEVANVAPPKLMGPPPPYKSRENLSLPNDAHPGGPSCSSRVDGSAEEGHRLSVIAEAIPSTSGAADSLVEPNDNTSVTNNEVFLDIVSHRDESMSSLNLESVENRDKDSQNSNIYKEESVNSLSLFENGNPSMSSNYSLKQVMHGCDLDNNNCNITSPSCSGDTASGNRPRRNVAYSVARSDTMNDISNNNSAEVFARTDSNNRQMSLSTLMAEQNGNPSTAASQITSNCGSELSNKPHSTQPSVFPPISLEFIDSDCVTE